jgi:hypothetical protein
MKTLQEFLSDRAEIERGKADEKKAVQSEWISAVRRLIQQIREWLRDADRENLLKIDEEYRELREENVGVYAAPVLIVRLEAREVSVLPIARMVVGPYLSNGIVKVNRCFGRVDLTDGANKFMLFRTQKDPSDEWVSVDDDGYRIAKFDRQAFEQAMQSLLR